MQPKDLLDFPHLSFDETSISSEQTDVVTKDSTSSKVSKPENEAISLELEVLFPEASLTTASVAKTQESVADRIRSAFSEKNNSTPNASILDEDFFLTPPDEERLETEKAALTNPQEHLEHSSVSSRFGTQDLPSIDWKIGEESEDIVPVTKNGDLWIPQESIIAIPEQKKQPESVFVRTSLVSIVSPEHRTYSSLEFGEAKPFLKRIQEFHARIESFQEDREISTVAALLFYMTDGAGIFFDYEEKWQTNKERYIARAEASHGTFFRRMELLLGRYGFADTGAGRDDVERIAHKIFLEKIELFKERFLDELVFDILPDDTAYVMRKIWSDSDDGEKKQVRFNDAQAEEFQFLFNFYFRKLQHLKRTKKLRDRQIRHSENERRENTPESTEVSGLAKEQLLSKIEDIETYFEEHVFVFFDEPETTAPSGANRAITEAAETVRARLDERRQERDKQ